MTMIDTEKILENSSSFKEKLGGVMNRQRKIERERRYKSVGGALLSVGAQDTALSLEIDQMIVELEDKEEEIKKVAELGLQLTVENSQLIREIEQLQNKLIDIEGEEFKFEELQQLIDDLEAETTELNRQNTYLRSKVEEAARINKEYLDQLEKSENDLRNVQKLLRIDQRLEEDNELLRTQLNDLTNIVGKLQESRDECHKIGQKLKKSNVLRRELENEKGVLIDELYQTKEKLDSLEKTAKENFERNSRSKELETDNIQLRAQNFWLEKVSIEKNPQALSTMLATFRSLKEEPWFSDAEETLKVIKRSIGETTDVVEEDLSFYYSQFEGSQEQDFVTNKGDSQRKVLYFSMLIWVQEELRKSLEEKLKILRENEELKEEIEELKQQQKSEKERRISIEEMLKSRERDLDEEERFRLESAHSKELLENELKIIKKEKRSLINQVEELKSELNKLTNESSQSKVQHNREIETLKSKYEKLIEELNNKWNNDLKKLKEEFNELKLIKKAEIEKIESEHSIVLGDLQFKLDTSLMNLEDSENLKKKIINEYEKKIKEQEELHTEALEELKRKLILKDKLNKELEKEIEELNLKIKLESEKCERAIKKKQEMEGELQVLKAKVEAELREKQRLLDENIHLEKRIKELLQENAELRKRLEELLNKQVVIEVVAPKQMEREPELFERELCFYINKVLKYDRDLHHVLPIGTKTSNLIEAVRDGVLLCKLINNSFPGSIDERVINLGTIEEESMKENHQLTVNTAMGIGCEVLSIKPELILEGDENQIILLTWEIIKHGLLSRVNILHHPELTQICEQGETGDDLMKYSPQEILLRWFNHHLHGHGRTATNFKSDLRDSELLGILLNKLSPKRCPIEGLLQEEDIDVRSEIVVLNAGKINLRTFITSQGIVSGEERLNIAFLANLFDSRSGLKLQQSEAKLILQSWTGTREERSFKIWINSLGVNPKVNNLYEDLRDGRILIQVIDKVEPGLVQSSKVNDRPRNLFEKAENCNYLIILGKKLKLQLATTAGRDILQANKNLVLGFVWQLMRFHVISILKKLKVLKGRKLDDSVMVKWCNSIVTESGKTSHIKSFRDRSLSKGRFIIDLIYSISPLSVNYSFVAEGETHEEKMNNALYAISLTRKLGGSIFLLPEDIVEVKEKMLLTMIGELMRIKKIREKSQTT